MSKLTREFMDCFFELTKGDSERHSQIMDQLNALRNVFGDDMQGWMEASLNRIPRTMYEAMYISYVFGSVIRTEHLN